VSGPAVVECAGLGLRFGGIVALEDVDFSVGRDEIVGVVGPNGSGKTCLINILSGYYMPTAGSVLLEGSDVTHRRPQDLRRLGVSRIFQNLRLYGELTVLENMELGMARDLASSPGVARAIVSAGLTRRQTRRRADIREQAMVLLEEHGFAGLAEVKIRSLSYGQCKELELLRAVLEPPNLLLLDEPTAGVAETQADEVKDRILVWRQRLGCSIVVVEHRLQWLFDLADRIVVLNSGRVIAHGRPAEIARNEEVRAAYVGS